MQEVGKLGVEKMYLQDDMSMKSRVNKEKMTIYYSYLTALTVGLVSLVAMAGSPYMIVMLIFAAAFHSLQYNKANSNLFRVMKSLLMGSIGVVCFIRTFPIKLSTLLTAYAGIFPTSLGMIFLGFIWMGTISNRSLFPNRKVANRFENMLVLGLMCLCAYGILSTFLFPIELLIISDKLSSMVVTFYQWSLYLVMMFAANHLVGRKPEDLLGFKVISFRKFMLYFMLGILVIVLSDMVAAVITPLFFSSEVLLLSVNIVQWDAASYFLYQTMNVFVVLVQTLVEEIAFRAVLDRIWNACGFGEGINNGRSQYKYVFELVIKSFLMSSWFAAAHLANPIENGRAFGSILEKFAAYFTHVSMSMAYLLTGNVALSWGMHFIHNFKIGMRRFSLSGTDNGFFMYNKFVDNASSSEMIFQSVEKMAVGVILVIGAYYYAEHVDVAEQSQDSVDEKGKIQIGRA